MEKTKLTRMVVAILAAGLAAQAAETPPKSKPASQAQASPSAGRSDNSDIIPADAKQIDAHTWMAPDKNGKKWFYRQTPFGVVKTDSDPNKETDADDRRSPFDGKNPAPRSAAAEKSLQKPAVKVTDLGDSYSFERRTPFGPSKWTRKKSELTDEEKALVSAPKPQTASAASK
jgi:hypothetical protein